MLINIILWGSGALLLVLGIIKAINYVMKYQQFIGYKNIKGFIVEHVSKECNNYFDNSSFGNDSINYNENDQMFLAQERLDNTLGIVEFVIKGKKHRIIDSASNTNLMPLGSEVLVKYNPKKFSDAFVVDKFEDEVLFIVGVFLIVIGFIV